MPDGAEKKRHPKKIHDGKYELEKKLGAGCFGEVFRGVNCEDKTQVAVKSEDVHGPNPQLESEYNLLQELQKHSKQQGFAECYWYGQEGNFNFLVMELLGKSLEDMVQKCGGKFDSKTTLLIAEQVLHRIEYLHSKGHIHRDIKPENFMFGAGSKVHVIYIIDFGLSKRYWDKNKHVILRQKLSLTGTARYASINAHKGMEQSRRDDLEAIGHMFMYFLRGAVPWSGLEAKTKQEKYKKIMEKKDSVPLSELCMGFPREFEDYLRYARSLQFTEKPNYDMLQEWFKKCRVNKGVKEEWEFQWFDQAPTGMVPLVQRTRIAQPDESQDAAESRKSTRFFCCGCKSAVRD